MKKEMFTPLFFDIETSYHLVKTWSKWQPSIDTIQHQSIMCIGYKLGNEPIKLISVVDDLKSFQKDPFNDKKVITQFLKVMEQADVVIGHNSDKFDLKKLRTRAIKHSLAVPVVKQYDTLKIAKRNFNFYSNKLGDLAKFLGVTLKLESSYSWWDKALLSKDPQAMKKIGKYCKGDVQTLMAVYDRLKGYDKPAINNQIFNKEVCPHCNTEDCIKQGYLFTHVGRYQRYSCKGCGHYFKGEKL